MPICAIIPALNEADRIGPVLEGIRAQVASVLVVDDGSRDRTAAVARDLGAEVLVHPHNHGKGRSLQDGLAHALRMGFDGFLTLDADGQHLPAEAGTFVEAAKGGADLVVGNRMDATETMPWVRRNTNRFMSWLVSRLAGVRIPDTQCGYRYIGAACWRAVAPGLRTGGFDFESEILIEAGRRGFRIDSVRVSTVYAGEQSKIRPVRDTIRFFDMVARKLAEPRPERTARPSRRKDPS